MRTAAKQALGLWWGSFALAFVALWLLLGIPADAGDAGAALGRLWAHAGFAALFTWLITRRRDPVWSWWKTAGLFLLIGLVLALVASVGRTRAAEPAIDWPLSLPVPTSWSAQRLDGVSSAPEDRGLGVRLRLMWRGESDEVAAMEFTCAWRDAVDAGDPARDADAVQQQTVTGYAAMGLDAERGAAAQHRAGGRIWHTREVSAHNDEAALQQQFALSRSSRCALTATLTGTPTAFAQHLPEFHRALDALQVN